MSVVSRFRAAPDDDNLAGWLGSGGIFFVVGLWLTIGPRSAWWFRHMFSFKNPEDVEPSTFVVVSYRIIGVFCLITGVMFTVIGVGSF